MLRRALTYLGAHSGLNRVANERQRTVQRMALAGSVPLLLLISQFLGATKAEPLEGFGIFAACYAVAAAAYWFAIGIRPQGLVLAQYGFMVVDPLVAVCAIAYEPDVFGWCSVLLMVMSARCGLRYGIRSFWFEWGWCASWAAIVLIGSGFVRTDRGMAAIVTTVLFVTPLLFVPLIQLEKRSREVFRKQVMMEAMETQLAAKSGFLSKVGHELRSPLQTILAALELFEEDHLRPSDVVFVGRVRRAAAAVNTQLRDLLTLARSDSGNLVLRPAKVDVRELLSGVCDDSREFAEFKGLALTLKVPTEPVSVYVDAMRLTQIVENLLTNAIKYTNDGAVTVRLQPFDSARGVVRFAIEDTGAGIAAEDAQAIFAPHERARAVGYERESAGMGLAVVQTLLAHMGGEVDVSSVVGAGSTFRVEVAASVDSEEEEDAHARRVLVVDDREECLEDICGLVRKIGYIAESARSAGEASNLLAARRYMAVLCDLKMPVKSGLQLATETRNVPGLNDGALWIAMTAGEDTETGRQAPFDAFLRKPFTGRLLKRALDVRRASAT